MSYATNPLTHAQLVESVRLKHETDFENTFNLSLDAFWSPVTGFDVIAFDQWLIDRGGDPEESVQQMITAQFGEEAVRLVMKIVTDEIELF
jgi:hypothetical protein